MYLCRRDDAESYGFLISHHPPTVSNQVCLVHQYPLRLNELLFFLRGFDVVLDADDLVLPAAHMVIPVRTFLGVLGL